MIELGREFFGAIMEFFLLPFPGLDVSFLTVFIVLLLFYVAINALKIIFHVGGSDD